MTKKHRLRISLPNWVVNNEVDVVDETPCSELTQVKKIYPFHYN